MINMLHNQFSQGVNTEQSATYVAQADGNFHRHIEPQSWISYTTKELQKSITLKTIIVTLILLLGTILSYKNGKLFFIEIVVASSIIVLLLIIKNTTQSQYKTI